MGKKTTTVRTNVLTKPKIKDFITDTSQGVILIDSRAMQEIFVKSGPLAKDNEFQVHYWFLNLRFRAPDNSILDIAIPTAYFNYKQEVSKAAIGFNMKQIGEISDQIKPLHNVKVNQLLELGIAEQFEALLGVKFETQSAQYGSIHRHPGSSSYQSFSTTDLALESEEPGVVFPFGEAKEDRPNFAGIMAIDNGQCRVAHYEYRTANGTLGTDIEYVQANCAAIVIQEEATLSTVQRLFGEDPKRSYTTLDNCSQSEAVIGIEKIAHELFLGEGYSPSTNIISEDNLSLKPVKTYNYNTASYAYDKPHVTMTKDDLNKLPLVELNNIQKNLHFKVKATRLYSYTREKDKVVKSILEKQEEYLKTPALAETVHTRGTLEVLGLAALRKVYSQITLKVFGKKLDAGTMVFQSIIAAILDAQKLDVTEPAGKFNYTEDKLQKLAFPAVVKIYSEFYETYYADVVHYAVATVTENDFKDKQECIDETLELQNSIIIEQQESVMPSKEVMIAEIVARSGCVEDGQWLEYMEQENIYDWYYTEEPYDV